MKQFIRWSGLAGFVVVTGLLVAFFMFAAGILVEMAIEKWGSKAAGAKVEVDNVSLSLSPLGFEIEGMQIADSDHPMHNVLEFDSAVAQLDLAPLFLGKGIIRDLSITNVQFNTQREESGELEKEPEEDNAGSVTADGKPEKAEKSTSDKAKEGLQKLAGKAPGVDEILSRESLKTERIGKTLNESFARNKKAVKDATDAVPNQQKLDQYQAEIKAILSGDFKSVDDFKARKKKLDDLKRRFKEDKAAVAAARQTIVNARSELSQQLKELKHAPGDDLASLKNKYQLNTKGAANLSGLLLGPEAGGWAKKALYWYNKVKPYLPKEEEGKEEEEKEQSRLAGRYVHFPSNNPWPSFLIRHMNMSAPVMGGQLAITGKDLTHQQDVLQRPALVNVQGQSLTNIEDLNIDAVLDHRRGIQRDTATLTVKDWSLRGMKLGIGGSQLSRAVVQVQGLAMVEKGLLKASSDAQFGQAEFSGSGKTTFAKELNLALAKITNFSVNAKASGKFSSPRLELGSDLDTRIGEAFKARLNDKQKELETKLKKRLNDKMKSYLGNYSKDLKELNLLDNSLDENAKKLQQLAGSRLEDFKAQQQRKLKEKEAELKRKKEEKQRELKARKAAKEAEIRRKKEEERRKAEEKKAAKKAELKRKEEAKRREIERKKKEELEKAKNKAKEKLKSLF